MIPVHQPVLSEKESALVVQALQEGEISGTGGRFIEEFEQKFADYCGCRYGIAVSSGTTALHLAVVAAGLGVGDEVLVSACTNIASGNAVVMEGGIVVPIDSEPDTWNMDVRLLSSAITPRTKAIMPVHIYGHPVDMDEVTRLAKEHNLIVIEDCAEAHGATYRGHKVGGLGDLGCFSFYANKVITTGEGGMIATNRADLAERARTLRSLAFIEPRFYHEDVGFNYRMTNIQAAIGVAQLERIEEIIATKRRLAHMYNVRLAGMRGLRLPVEKGYARNVYWMYCIVLEPEFGLTRDEFASRLLERGIDTRTMFCPLNIQPAYLKRNAVRPLPCPVAENLWQSGLYLPSGCALTEQEVDYICDTIKELAQ